MKLVTDFVLGHPGASLGPSRLDFGDCGGWGLYATRDVEADEITVTVPKELCFAARDEIELAEKIYRARNNPWLDYLLSQNLADLPLMWDSERIEHEFRGLSILKDLREKREKVPENVRRAHAVVASRAYWIQQDTLVLAPLLDFANHHYSLGGVVEEGDGVYVDENSYYLQSTEKLGIGQQVCSNYAANNADLYAWFGFVEDTHQIVVDFDFEDVSLTAVLDRRDGSLQIDEEDFLERLNTPRIAERYFQKRLEDIPPPSSKKQCSDAGIETLRREERLAVSAARDRVAAMLPSR